jgi:hypothetical protein
MHLTAKLWRDSWAGSAVQGVESNGCSTRRQCLAPSTAGALDSLAAGLMRLWLRICIKGDAKACIFGFISPDEGRFTE